MKLLLLFVGLAVGCGKSDKVGTTTGSGTASGSAPTAPVGSAAAGSAATPAAGSANASAAGSQDAAAAAGAPAKLSELAKAIDDFDRWLAPIWKLPDKERFVALCGAAKSLITKADAIRAMPNGAADWQTTADGLSMALGMAQKCCVEQPKNLSPDLQAVQDENNAECIKPVHDDFAAVAKLVPGAPAADSHANDPMLRGATKP